MEIKFSNATQCKIADLLWAAETKEDVDKIIRVFGHDARVVHNMMVAATFDEFAETELASQVLDKFRL